MAGNYVLVAVVALVVVFTVADTPSWRSKGLAIAVLAVSFALPRLVDWQHARAVSSILQASLAITLIVYLRFHRYLK